MSKLDWRQQALVTCASKDVTRFRLNAVGFMHGRFYSTDGHRLMVTKQEWALGIDPKEGGLYDPKIFKDGHLVSIGDYKGIDWKQICGSVNRSNTVRIRLPHWLKDVKHFKKSDESFPVAITLKGLQTHGDENDTWVNPHYLAPIAGQDCFMHFKDGMSPVIFTSHDRQIEDCDWSYTVMPIRPGKIAFMTGSVLRVKPTLESIEKEMEEANG